MTNRDLAGCLLTFHRASGGNHFIQQCEIVKDSLVRAPPQTRVDEVDEDCSYAICFRFNHLTSDRNS